MQYQRLNREGVFLAKMIDQSVQRKESGAVMFDMVFLCVAQYDSTQDAYVNLVEPEECLGNLCLIRKDGTVSQTSIERLSMALKTTISGFTQLQDTDWSGVEVQITVKADEYKGKVRFRADWIAAGDAPVSGATLTRASTDELQKLNATFGAQLRALSPVVLTAPDEVHQVLPTAPRAAPQAPPEPVAAAPKRVEAPPPDPEDEFPY